MRRTKRNDCPEIRISQTANRKRFVLASFFSGSLSLPCSCLSSNHMRANTCNTALNLKQKSDLPDLLLEGSASPSLFSSSQPNPRSVPPRRFQSSISEDAHVLLVIPAGVNPKDHLTFFFSHNQRLPCCFYGQLNTHLCVRAQHRF